jgi:hypothetical protein
MLQLQWLAVEESHLVTHKQYVDTLMASSDGEATTYAQFGRGKNLVS